MKDLQAALQTLLEQKVQRPDLALHAVGKEIIATIVDLLTKEVRLRGIDRTRCFFADVYVL